MENLTVKEIVDEFTLKIKFENQEQLDHFATWLCNKGNSHYRECGRDSGDYEPVDLIFHHPQDLSFPANDERRFENAKFINDNTILVNKTKDEKQTS